MKCPICRKEVSLPREDAPFCSRRCKLIDLGNWASETYVISTPLKPGEAAGEQGQPEEIDEE